MTNPSPDLIRQVEAESVYTPEFARRLLFVIEVAKGIRPPKSDVTAEFIAHIDSIITARVAAALAAIQAAPAKAEGWKLVPVDPTDEQLRAALVVDMPATYREYLRHPANGPRTSKVIEEDIDRAKKRYSAYLCAAPSPSGEQKK